MTFKDLKIAVPLFFEAIFGSVIKFLYMDVWIYTYGLFPRPTNMDVFIWITSRPGLTSFRSHLKYRREHR